MIEIPDLKDYPPRPGEHPRRRWWLEVHDRGEWSMGPYWRRLDGLVALAAEASHESYDELTRIDRETPIPMPPLRAGQVWMDLRTGCVVTVSMTVPPASVPDGVTFRLVAFEPGARVPGDPGIVLLYDPFGGPWAPVLP